MSKIDPDQFKKRYWEKKELINLCRINGLSVTGLKQDLTDRIYTFLTNGEKKSSSIQSSRDYDSDREICLDTPVKHYRNDARTRAFFEKHIKNFHFNLYLRAHAKMSPQQLEGITYGDLVNGWIEFEEGRKQPGFIPKIGKQFEYNQFIQDYFADPNEKNKSRQSALSAWKKARMLEGEHTYLAYKKHFKKSS